MLTEKENRKANNGRKEVKNMEEIERHELKPGEVCPYCGQKKRGGWKKIMTEKQIKANQKNGLKGGRPKKNV